MQNSAFLRPGLSPAEREDSQGTGLGCKVGISSSKNSCQTKKRKRSIYPLSLPCSFPGWFPVPSTPHPPSFPQSSFSPGLKRRHFPRDSLCDSALRRPQVLLCERSGPILPQSPKYLTTSQKIAFHI